MGILIYTFLLLVPITFFELIKRIVLYQHEQLIVLWYILILIHELSALKTI